MDYGKGDDADDYRQKRACRRCQSHREQGARKEGGGQVHARDAHQRNGNDVMQK